MSKSWDAVAAHIEPLARKSRSMSELADSLAPHLGRRVSGNAVSSAVIRLRDRGHNIPLPSEILGADLDPGDGGRAQERTPEHELREHRLKRLAEELKRQKKDILRRLELAEERSEIALAVSHPTSDLAIKAKSAKGREAVAVALASDWHLEEDVDPATVNGRNRYTPAIAEQRATKYFRDVAGLIRHHSSGPTGFKIPRLILWAGGDMITGYIHDELVESNHLSPTEAILFFQKLWIAGIRYLLAEVPGLQIDVLCSYGNHGRTTQRRRVSTGAKNSFEWLGYHGLAQAFDGERRVNFRIADGAHLYAEVYDWTIRFHHGDDVRYQGGIGGLAIPLRKAIDSWNQFRHADIDCIGHWHQLVDYGFAVVNGSLIGYNAYALSIKARYEPARQAFFLMDSKRGKSHVTPIWVE